MIFLIGLCLAMLDMLSPTKSVSKDETCFFELFSSPEPESCFEISSGVVEVVEGVVLLIAFVNLVMGRGRRGLNLETLPFRSCCVTGGTGASRVKVVLFSSVSCSLESSNALLLPPPSSLLVLDAYTEDEPIPRRAISSGERFTS